LTSSPEISEGFTNRSDWDRVDSRPVIYWYRTEDSVMNATADASRKLLVRLHAGSENGNAVRLRFYLSTPLFTAPPAQRAGLVMRIYRRAAPGFVFGEDYAEYFDGATPQPADLIFEGTLAAINERIFEFVDREVAQDATYLYWVSTDRGETPTGPAAVKVRNPDVWWTAATLQARLDDLARKYPQRVTLKEYGRSVRGRPIVGILAGEGPATIGLVGAVHAGESGPELIVPALERLLAEDADLLGRVRIAALPSTNIDEREELANGRPWYLRKNANGVDLNRNFDSDWDTKDTMYGFINSDPDAETYRGPAPASEPETRAIVKFVDELKPAVLFAYHGLGSITGTVFLGPKSAASDVAYRQTADPLLTAYTAGFLHDENQAERTPRLTATPGSFPDWCYRKRGIPCFDVEGGGRDFPVEMAGKVDRATSDMMREYRQRHYRAIRAVMRKLCR